MRDELVVLRCILTPQLAPCLDPTDQASCLPEPQTYDELCSESLRSLPSVQNPEFLVKEATVIHIFQKFDR